MNLISTLLLLGPIVLLLAVLLWWLKDKTLMWQFPLLMLLVYVGFFFPQTVGILRNPGVLPPGVVADGGMAKMLLMVNLCIAMGLVGYGCGRPSSRRHAVSRQYNMEKLFRGGCVLVVIGYVGVLLEVRLGGGIVGFLSVEESSGPYAGLPVVFSFIAGIMFPGLVCCIVSTLARPTRAKWHIVAAMHFWPLVAILFLGRRSGTIGLVLVWGMLMFFARRWLPPRWAFATAFLIAFLFVLIAPDYREQTRIGGDWTQILRTNPIGKIKGTLFEGRGCSEVEAATVLIAAYDRAGEFWLGRNIWNRFVSSFVPRMLVGSEIKASLFWPGPNQNVLTMRYYGWKRGVGTMVTFAADLFREFWYFGCGVMFLLGVVFARLWVSSTDCSSPASQIWYVLLLPATLTSLPGGILHLPPRVLYYGIWIIPVLLYARLPQMSPFPGRVLRPKKGIAATRTAPVQHRYPEREARI